MGRKTDSELQELQIEGSPERGYRHEGEHFYVWQRDRSEAISWVEELSPFDRRRGPPGASPTPNEAPAHH